MLTPDDFRRIALEMADAIESAHMGHPDFRANGRIFATLYPDGERGMVKLTPEQQRTFMRRHAAIFSPASGAWGRQGCTTVTLEVSDATTVRRAMEFAWHNTVKKRVARPSKAKRPPVPARPSRPSGKR
jgi:hypothetical protein